MAAIIFDFDGTIADSFDFVVDFLVRGADLPPLTGQEKQAFRGMSMMAIGRSLGYSWWRLFRMFFIGRRRMGRHIVQISPIEGVPDVIRKLQAEGHELFIVTSNTVRNVRKFLEHHKLRQHFLKVYGNVGLFSKAPALKKLFKDQNLELKDAFYIGDEVRDVEAAQSLGLKIIAVTWGFARPSDLANLQPTALADAPEDLIRILADI